MRGAPGERVAQVEELPVREVLEGGQAAGAVRILLTESKIVITQ